MSEKGNNVQTKMEDKNLELFNEEIEAIINDEYFDHKWYQFHDNDITGTRDILAFYYDKAINGCKVSQYMVGNWHYYIGSNPEESITWFELSAKQGFVIAQVDLGHIYTSEDQPINNDLDKGIYWFTQASINQYPTAKTSLKRVFKKNLNEFIDKYVILMSENKKMTKEIEIKNDYIERLEILPEGPQFSEAEQRFYKLASLPKLSLYNGCD